MPSKSSSSSSSKAAGISPRAATRATSPRAATRATSPRAATRAVSPRAATRATSPRAVSPRAATRTTSPRAVSPRAAFTAAVAAKDTNRLHNIPEDIQKEIMRMAREKKINSQGKYEIYKKIYNNREVFLEWLEEIKRNGVDDKKRVRNPLRKGGLIYTNKGLYSTIVNLCIAIFPADFKWDTIPPRIKIEYKQQNKFYNKPR